MGERDCPVTPKQAEEARPHAVLYSSPPHETTTMFMLFLAASQVIMSLEPFGCRSPHVGARQPMRKFTVQLHGDKWAQDIYIQCRCEPVHSGLWIGVTCKVWWL